MIQRAASEGQFAGDANVAIAVITSDDFCCHLGIATYHRTALDQLHTLFDGVLEGEIGQVVHDGVVGDRTSGSFSAFLQGVSAVDSFFRCLVLDFDSLITLHEISTKQINEVLCF